MRAAAALALIWLAAALSARAEPVGYVLQVEGTWRVKADPTPLAPGSGVPAGGMITPDSSQARGSITVVLIDHSQLSSSCAKAPCTASLQIPVEPLKADTGFQRILEAVKYVLLNEGPKLTDAFDSTSSRDFGSHKNEILAAYSPGAAIPLSDVMTELTPGRYLVQLRPMDSSEMTYTGEVEWHTAAAPSMPLPAPGLHLLTVKNRFGQTALDVLVDVVNADKYRAKKAAYEEALQRCREWPGDSEAAHLFLRAFLIFEEPQL